MGGGHPRKDDAARALRAPAAGAERGTVLLPVRRHRPARSAAPRVCAGPLDDERRGAHGALQGADRRCRRVPRVAAAHAAARQGVLRSLDDADANRSRSGRHPAPAGVARPVVARVRRRRPSGRSGAAAAKRRGRSDRCRVADRHDRVGGGAAPGRASRPAVVRPARVCRCRRNQRARRCLSRAAGVLALPDAAVDVRAHRHQGARGVCDRRATGRPYRGARRPSRLRGAGAVPGRARAPHAHGRRRDARRASRAEADRTAHGVTDDRGWPLCGRGGPVAARRPGRRDRFRADH